MRSQLTAIFCFAAILQSSTATPLEPKTGDDAHEVIKLVELLTRDDDPAALERARWLLMMRKSPAEVMDPAQESPGHVIDNWDLPRVQNEALFDLGEYLMAHRSQFPKGLPALPSHLNALRLSQLIDGLSRGYGMTDTQTVAVLSKLADESWLEVADRSGQIGFSMKIRIFRGALPELLRSAEDSDDDLTIMNLGSAALIHPIAVRKISPELFRTRTLALFLSGAFASIMPDRQEAEMSGACQSWWKTHPTLLSELKHLRGNHPSMVLPQIGELWSRGEKLAAWQLLFPEKSRQFWWGPSFAHLILTKPQITDGEVEKFCQMMPYEILAEYVHRIEGLEFSTKEEANLNSIMKQALDLRNAQSGEQGKERD